MASTKDLLILWGGLDISPHKTKSPSRRSTPPPPFNELRCYPSRYTQVPNRPPECGGKSIPIPFFWLYIATFSANRQRKSPSGCTCTHPLVKETSPRLSLSIMYCILHAKYGSLSSPIQANSSEMNQLFDMCDHHYKKTIALPMQILFFKEILLILLHLL